MPSHPIFKCEKSPRTEVLMVGGVCVLLLNQFLFLSFWERTFTDEPIYMYIVYIDIIN